MHSDNDSEIGNDNNDFNAGENENGNDNCHAVLEAVDVLEMILSFHALYKCGGPFQCGNITGKKEIHCSIVKLLETVKKEIPHLFTMDGNCRSFMICCMFQEICIFLVIHKLGCQSG